jgi:chemotaxis family two-component system response regulator Rcp1
MRRAAERPPLEVLLVEDNPGDVRLTREALKEASTRTRLSVVQDGAEALEFLRREGRHAEAPRPDVVLLDLNLPRRDGREVLGELKGDPALLTIPVVILTSSDADRDVAAAYALHANCYVTKPTDLDEYISVLRAIEQFWFGVVQLPPRPGP